MKRLSFRRKSLLRALRAAALAFLCWIAAQRQAQAQLSISQTGNNLILSGTGSGSDYLNIGSNTSSNVYLSSSTPSGLFTAGGTVTIQTGTVITDTSIATTSFSGYNPVVGSQLGGTFSNNGSLTLNQTAGQATGIYVRDSSGNPVTINNGAAGSISVTDTSAVYSASGIYAGTSGGGAIIVDNRGTVSVDSANSTGIFASGDGNIQVTNELGAVVTASSSAYGAYGIFVRSNAGSVLITNRGAASATSSSTYSAYGIQAFSNAEGPLTVDNSGTVQGTNTGTGVAYGISASGSYSALTGIHITNEVGGQVTGNAAFGSAYGINVFNPFSGSVTTVDNLGTVSATGGFVLGINVVVGSGTVDNSVTIDNSGTVSATGSEGSGIQVQTSGTTLITNEAAGTISVATSTGSAYGIVVENDSGNLTIVNNGSIQATVSGSSVPAIGIDASAGTSIVTITNAGTILSTSSGYSDGIKVSNTSGSSPINVTNAAAGQITATAAGNAAAIDVNSRGTSNVSILNAGALNATSTGSFAYGINVNGNGSGSALITNSGTASGTTGSGAYLGYGIQALSSGGGALTIDNFGSAQGTNNGAANSFNSAIAYGIAANASAGGDIHILNEVGALAAATTSGIACGISATTGLSGQVVTIDNLGTAFATGGILAYGIQTNAAASTIDNFGGVSAIGSGAYGIQAEDAGASLITNEAAGTISTSSSGSSSYGIYAYTSSGEITITNNGSIQATSASNYSAVGIIAYCDTSAITITNAGAILATNSGAGSSEGIQVIEQSSGSNPITVTNAAAGQIAATAAGTSTAINVSNSGGTGNVSILNAGALNATSTGSAAYGIFAQNGNASASSLYVKNTGSITASGSAAFGIALGSPGTVYDSGNITAATNAINVPSGSIVTLAGTPVINGLITGGSTGTSSTLNFNLTVRSNYNATAAALDAVIAADAYQTGATSVVINGNTYQFSFFHTVTDGLIQGMLFSQAPGFQSMGNALDGLSGSTNPHAFALLGALGTVSDANLSAVLAQLSSAKVSQQLLSAPTTQAIFQNMQLDSRLTQVRSGFADGIDVSDFQFANSSVDPLLSQVQGRLYAYNPAPTTTRSDTPNNLSSDEQFARWGTFLSGNAVLANQNATASQNHADSTTVDITAGADYRLNKNWAVGFLFGYGRTTADVDSFGSRLGGNQYRFGPYVGYNDGPWYANASGYFAVNQETSDRAVPLLGQNAHSNPDGTQYGFNADGGYDFKAGHLTYGPTGGLQYTHLDVNSYNESGSDADLSLASQHSDSLLSSVGAKADYDLHWKWNNSTVRPEVRASWLHEFEGSNSPINAAFNVPGSASFSLAPAHQERESALLGGGVQNIFPGGSLLFLDYDAQVQNNYLAQSITGGFKVVF